MVQRLPSLSLLVESLVPEFGWFDTLGGSTSADERVEMGTCSVADVKSSVTAEKPLSAHIGQPLTAKTTKCNQLRSLRNHHTKLHDQVLKDRQFRAPNFIEHNKVGRLICFGDWIFCRGRFKVEGNRVFHCHEAPLPFPSCTASKSSTSINSTRTLCCKNSCRFSQFLPHPRRYLAQSPSTLRIKWCSVGFHTRETEGTQ